MKVLIVEPFTGGHHTEFIAHLLPSLVQLLDARKIDEVVVCISRKHRASAPFEDMLAPFLSRVTFDATADVDEYRWNSSPQVYAMVNRAIAVHRPDFVIDTSANHAALLLALQSFCGSPLRRKNVTSIGILHHGLASPGRTVRERVRDRIHQFSRRFAPWSELLIVNPLLFDAVRTQAGWTASRVKLVAAPVAIRPPIEMRAARSLLGLPLDGRYIGHVGKMDARMALPELLAAFAAAPLAGDDRLLLAGSLHAPYAELIENTYAHLVAAGRLIVIDRYLSKDEIHRAYCAIDLSAITYYPAEELSAKMLEAVAAERPVIANRFGYTGMLVDAFSVGDACDVRDIAELSRTIERGLDASRTYSLSPRARRLVAFNDPGNYAQLVLAKLYQRVGWPNEAIKTWDWVVGAA